MPRFKVNPKMYVIPNNDDFILYSPLTGSILEVTPSIVKELQNISFGEKYNLDRNVQQVLKEKGFINKRKFPAIKEVIPEFKGYKPTAVTLMPTWDCNLRCKYCYSHGGENPGDLLDIKIAKSAIDLITENSLEKGLKQISVGYHGGGEPLMHQNMDWIKEITAYSRDKADKNDLKSIVSSATNGFVSEKNLEWTVNNLDAISLSWDGVKEIQNLHRPGINGIGTYDKVLSTAKYLESKNFRYAIRSTISDKSVNRMKDIVELFINETTVESFHLEPLFECGRGEENTDVLRMPLMTDFVKNFIVAKELAEKHGRKLYHSATQLEKVGRKFCGAAESNFFVTPDGNITSCLEVSRPEDDMNNIFLTGEFDHNQNKFVLDEGRLALLRTRVVENVEGCGDCFAEYNCSGDCLAKSYATSRSLFDSRDSFRCESNRELLLHEIKQKLKYNEELKEV